MPERIFNEYTYTEAELSARVKHIAGKTPSGADLHSCLKQILGFIDLTTLSGDDTFERVSGLCKKATRFLDTGLGIPNVAAVCVYPVFAGAVSQALTGTDIKTACVAGAFPSGQSPLQVRVDEVQYAVDHGAEEIDMVISRGRLIEGNEDYVVKEVTAIKEACGKAHLKVILETGELPAVALVRRASELAILAGADFIKTSTGKIHPAATPEAFLIMLDTIKEYHEHTGKKIGIKPAGGISEPGEAMLYYTLVKEVLGEEWLDKAFFRIGASRLADKLYNEIIHMD